MSRSLNPDFDTANIHAKWMIVDGEVVLLDEPSLPVMTPDNDDTGITPTI